MNRETSVRRSLLALLFVPFADSAAQEPDSTRRDSVALRLRAVRITDARAAGIAGGTSAVVVNPEAIRASPAPLLHEALRESPFVHVRLNSRGEMELSIRGSDSRQAAVLVDGVPITLGWDHRTDPSLVPITGAQRLVIVPGLGSLLAGPNTLGGTIEVSHDDALARKSEAWGGFGIDEFGSTVATIGSARRLGTSGPGGVYLRGGLAHRQRDGVALSAGAIDPTAAHGLRTNSDLRELDGFASVRWTNGMGRSLGVTYSAFDAERGVPPEEHIASPRLWRYPYHRRSIGALSAASGPVATPFGYGSFEAGVGLNDGSMKIDSFDDRDYRTVTGQELGDEKTLTLRTKVTHSLGSRVSLRAGWTTADVKYTETIDSDPGARYEQKLSSVGAETEASIAERTAIAGGMVFDRSATPLTGGREPKQDPFSSIGWRAGVTHTLHEGLMLHASASRRSRFPALRELYSGALNRFQPNSELKPETLLGYEAGATLSQASLFGVSATLRVNAFNHRLADAVVRTTVPNPAPPPSSLFKRVNRDRIESTGIEALAGFQFGTNAERAVTLSGDGLFQRISIFDQTDNDAERHAENNPETRASVELGVPLPFELRGSATTRYTGRQYCVNGDTGSEMTLAGAAVTNLAFERRLPIGGGIFRSLRALFAIDNLGDKTVYDQCGLPQAGRTLRVMFTFR